MVYIVLFYMFFDQPKQLDTYIYYKTAAQSENFVFIVTTYYLSFY